MGLDDYSTLEEKRVLITGADGMLGRGFSEALSCHAPSARVLALSREQLDVTDLAQVMSLESERVDIIIHCAGLTNADRCELEPAETWRVHVGGTENILQLARAGGARVFYPQSVFIFDGRELPVTEHTLPSPTFEYGRAKLEAERLVLAHVPDSLVVRMAGFFGGDDKDKNFVGTFTRTLERMCATDVQEIEVGDRLWQPTYTLDHARNSLLLLARSCTGIYHMGAIGEATFHDVATACVESLGLGERISVLRGPAQSHTVREAARRPARMVTANERLNVEGLNRQRPWRIALDEYLRRPFFDRVRNVFA